MIETMCNGGQAGQATIEYLAVAAVLIIMFIALGALWRFVSGDGLLTIVNASASHVVIDSGGVFDVILY